MRMQLDEQWIELRKIAADRDVLLGSDNDWAIAHHAWRILDFFQKQAAIADVRDRPLGCNGLAGLPQTYFAARKWERPMPKAQEEPRKKTVLDRMREMRKP